MKMIKISFNNKEYKITGECLLALILNEFIQHILKQILTQILNLVQKR